MYYISKKKKTSATKKKSITPLVHKLDVVFSKYIRLRDSKMYGYKMFRCISCGRILPFEQADAGHFISRKNMSTRFDEENVHAECRACNRFSADHIINYQHNLRVLIGQDRLDMLTVRGKQTKKWSAFELEILIKYYTERIKDMEEL